MGGDSSHDVSGKLGKKKLLSMRGDQDTTRKSQCVESTFYFARCIRHGSVEAPRLWQKMAMLLLANVEEYWVRKKNGRPFRSGRSKKHTRFAVPCVLTTLVPFEGSPGTDVEGANSGSRKMGFGPKAGESMVDEYL